MRKSIICLLCAVCALTGCIDNVHSDYTPEIYATSLFLSPQFRNDSLVAAADTLYWSLQKNSSSLTTDTLQVGDTCVFGTTFYAVGNALQSVAIAWDTAAVQMWFTLPQSIKEVLSDTTQLQQGLLPFPASSNYNLVSFPLFFTPRTSGTCEFQLTVSSDSKYSPVTLSFAIPVR